MAPQASSKTSIDRPGIELGIASDYTCTSIPTEHLLSIFKLIGLVSFDVHCFTNFYIANGHLVSAPDSGSTSLSEVDTWPGNRRIDVLARRRCLKLEACGDAYSWWNWNLEVLVFVKGGKLENPEKTLGTWMRANNELNPNMTQKSGNRMQDTLVGGEHSHHCAVLLGKTRLVPLFTKSVYEWVPANLIRRGGGGITLR